MLKKQTQDKGSNFYINILIGAAIAVGVILLTMLIAAALMVFFNISVKYASPIASVCAGFGTFIGAYFAARKNGVKGLINGLLVAAVIFVIVTIVSAFLNDQMTIMSLIHLAVIVLSGCIGGIMGVNKREKRKIV